MYMIIRESISVYAAMTDNKLKSISFFLLSQFSVFFFDFDVSSSSKIVRKIPFTFLCNPFPGSVQYFDQITRPIYSSEIRYLCSTKNAI